jgi:hypothetical protein
MGRISGMGLAVAVAAACLVAGCASMQTTEWTGHKIDEVIKEFGPPTRTVPAAEGQTMYVWEREHSFPQSSWVSGPGGSAVATTSRKQLTTWSFLINQERTIVSWHRDEGGMY